MSQFNLPPAAYIASINSAGFEETALALFRWQHARNAVYRAYCDALRIIPASIRVVEEIPFLPISFFKTERVQTGEWIESALKFESSGTTGETPGRHFVKDAAIYEEALLAGFLAAFGPVDEWTFLALLPSYLERPNSSLVHMMRVLMSHSKLPDNGFYLDELEALSAVLRSCSAKTGKTMLLGVTFALIDFASAYPMDLSGITVMGTGGMKGRREEWTRERVHDHLKRQWNLPQVATEYGMTELLSQAYALREGLLTPSPTVRVYVRELTDPLSTARVGNGALNIIDLANVHSCAFIATEDVGVVYDAGTFEVQGRLDQAALRGCSLLTA